MALPVLVRVPEDGDAEAGRSASAAPGDAPASSSGGVGIEGGGDTPDPLYPSRRGWRTPAEQVAKAASRVSYKRNLRVRSSAQLEELLVKCGMPAESSLEFRTPLPETEGGALAVDWAALPCEVDPRGFADAKIGVPTRAGRKAAALSAASGGKVAYGHIASTTIPDELLSPKVRTILRLNLLRLNLGYAKAHAP